MSDTVTQIASVFETWKQEDEKFENGNASAGTRARKALQEIAKLAKARRAEISEVKNAKKAEKVAS
jgi:hypothetical protein